MSVRRSVENVDLEPMDVAAFIEEYRKKKGEACLRDLPLRRIAHAVGHVLRRNTSAAKIGPLFGENSTWANGVSHYFEISPGAQGVFERHFAESGNLKIEEMRFVARSPVHLQHERALRSVLPRPRAKASRKASWRGSLQAEKATRTRQRNKD